MRNLNNSVFVRIIPKDEVKTVSGITIDIASMKEGAFRVKVESVHPDNEDGLKVGDIVVIPNGQLRVFHIDDKMDTGFVTLLSILCVL